MDLEHPCFSSYFFFCHLALINFDYQCFMHYLDCSVYFNFEVLWIFMHHFLPQEPIGYYFSWVSDLIALQFLLQQAIPYQILHLMLWSLKLIYYSFYSSLPLLVILMNLYLSNLLAQIIFLQMSEQIGAVQQPLALIFIKNLLFLQILLLEFVFCCLYRT